jgi:isoquinoline 1-oxidoreductase alpha subunit
MVMLDVNGTPRNLDVPDEMPLLWVLRDVLGMTGTKFGCGAALCGACTIHIDGQPVRSCVTPVSVAVGKRIATIEGIATPAGKKDPGGVARAGRRSVRLPPVRPDRVRSRAARRQCPAGDAEIDSAMAGNICRCGTYPRIRAAINRAAGVKEV